MGDGIGSHQQTSPTRQRNAPLPTDHANVLSNLSDASNSQKNQIEELAKEMLALTKEVKELRNNRSGGGNKDYDDKENMPLSNKRNRRHGSRQYESINVL